MSSHYPHHPHHPHHPRLFHHQQQEHEQHPLAHLQHNAINAHTGTSAHAHIHHHARQQAFTDRNSPETSGQLTLPDRDVTAATIEDAYVRFIFYCNPALPHGADAESLREAFRNPPRSGGKLFSPYTIFELVKKFYMKEIKTWTELTTLLGVEPPDPGKDESTQKIAQYGVRLKKWMNSMHIKAFFEYLMDIPNEYWTQIPDGPDPIAQPVRDGIALEDDMSLRALLPHIRPKRGRKRPDDQPADTPTQKQRLSPPSTHESLPSNWTKQPDALPPRTPVIDAARPGAASWEMSNPLPTPNENWTSSSGDTPPTRSSFWDDALEQQSAITPPKPNKTANQRRGAKNVSSAWKSSGWDPASAKTRGRPPLSHRTKDEGQSPPYVSQGSAFEGQEFEMRDASAMTWIAGETHNAPSYGATVIRHDPGPAQILITGPPPEFTETPNQVESMARSNAYRQVSDEAGPLVYRASPPAANSPPDGSQGPTHANYVWRSPEELLSASASVSVQVPIPPIPVPVPIPSPIPVSVPISAPAQMADAATSPARTPLPRIASANSSPRASSTPSTVVTTQKEDVKEWYFEKMTDRVNIDPMISYFTHVLRNADWIDPQGNHQEPAGMAECTAMANSTIENMYRSAESTQAFLINLAALAGARMLMTTRPRCYRGDAQRDIVTYHFDWQYRFGDLSGSFSMVHSIPIKMWKKQPFRDDFRVRTGDGAAIEPLTLEQWQGKYEALMEESERLNREIFEMQDRVMNALK